jgi:hypothetical protein
MTDVLASAADEQEERTRRVLVFDEGKSGQAGCLISLFTASMSAHGRQKRWRPPAKQ